MTETQKKPNYLKRYVMRFLIGMTSYVILLVAAVVLANTMEQATGRVLLGLLPSPAVLFVAWAVVQYSREADEFARRQLTESLAIGFAFGSALVASYGLLDSFGAPARSWMFAFATYMLCWAVGSFIVSLKYRS